MEGVPQSDYEGAGFLLSFMDMAILGERVKKPDDLAKDPTLEFEYMGGKRDKDDHDDPFTTALSELIEELGGLLIDTSDWEERASIVHIFQPFTKKWIWCFRLKLNQSEFNAITSASAALQSWDLTELRNMSHLTGRSTPVRKGLSRLVAVSLDELSQYVNDFNRFPTRNEGNRMKDAKEYRSTRSKLSGYDLNAISGAPTLNPLRAFNTVIFANNVHSIKMLQVGNR